MALEQGELFAVIFLISLMFIVPVIIHTCCEIINKCCEDDDSSEEDTNLVNPASDYGYSTFSI